MIRSMGMNPTEAELLEMIKLELPGCIWPGVESETGQWQITCGVSQCEFGFSNILAVVRLELNEAAVPMKIQDYSGS